MDFVYLEALADDPEATLSAWITELRDMFGAWNAERKEVAKRESIGEKTKS
jgi:hypothetical protein